jgi:hypothetical protein
VIAEYDCEVCGTHVRTRRSPANGGATARYCGQGCYHAARTGKGSGPIPNHSFVCEVCGMACEVYRAPSAQTPRFCSLQCLGEAQRGDANPAWQGGRRVHSAGYVYVYVPDHPDADVRGCILEHRLVMEGIVGRRLTAVEVVHHRNRVTGDNRPDNLQLLPDQAAHMRLHAEVAD